MLLVILTSLMCVTSSKYVELCCTFTDTLQKDLTMLSAMFSSVDYKLIMGCSMKPKTSCACFESTWGCTKLTISDLQTKESYEVDNGPPQLVFDHAMRGLIPAVRAADRDRRHTYFCEGGVITPYIWSLVAQGHTTWTSKKNCISPILFRLKSKTILGVTTINNPLKYVIDNFKDMDQLEFANDTQIMVQLITTSELSHNLLTAKLKQFSTGFNVTKRSAEKNENLHMEEIIMEYKGMKCRTFNYMDCLIVINLYIESAATNTVYHLSDDLLDLFLTTATTPAVLLVYSHDQFRETQELAVKLDSSLGQSLLGNYTVAMMGKSERHTPGVYHINNPNNIKKCTTEVYQCLSAKFKGYLPPASSTTGSVVGVVYGEQHVGSENDHRGNFNNPLLFEPRSELDDLSEIKQQLVTSDYIPELKSETTSLTVLTSEGYYKTIAQSTGHFILFVFRSDLVSLYTIKQVLGTKLTGLYLVECFNLNVICGRLGIDTYPALYFVKDNDTIQYNGRIEEVAMKMFRELIEFPVITEAHRIQIDLVLKGGERKAAVLISSGKADLVAEFREACSTIHGFIQCFLLAPKNPAEDTLIVHVPEDPVMINKKYQLANKQIDMTKVIKKLATPSVISESEFLLSYKDMSDLVLFEAVVDDKLAPVVNIFPFVQFVQVSSSHFKHNLLRELIGYDYEGAVLFISKSRRHGYRLPTEATLDTWIAGCMDGTLSPDFILKDLEASKYQYHDIFYRRQFNAFEHSVRTMRKKVNELNKSIAQLKLSHQEL